MTRLKNRQRQKAMMLIEIEEALKKALLLKN